MVRLPVEYQEVEYLESTGTQYIKTNYTPTATEDMKIEMDYMFTKTQSGDSFLFGAKASGTSPINFQGECYDNRWFCGSGLYQFRSVLGNVGTSLNKRHSFIIDGNVLKVDDNSASSTKTQSNLYSVPLYIFAGNWNEATSFINKGARIYNLSFTANRVKEADFIPCYRKSDSEPGMYDTVSGVFFTNAGTGTFLVGNDVSWDTASLIERRRQILLNTPHISTLSANPLTFQTDISANLKDCKIYFEPIQEGSGDPSPDNVRPITGWDGVTVTRTGENFITSDIDWLSKRIRTINNVISGSVYYSFYFPVPKGTLHLYKRTTSISYMALADKVPEIGDTVYNSRVITNYNGFDVTMDNTDGHPYMILCGPTVAPTSSVYEFAEDNEVYVGTVPYSNITGYPKSQEGTSITIPFPQTIYGGYVDLVKGEVVEEMHRWIEDGSRAPIYWVWDKDESIHSYCALFGGLPEDITQGIEFNEMDMAISPTRKYIGINATGRKNPNKFSIYRHKSASFSYSFIGEEFATMTKADLQAYLSEHPEEIVYALKAPITHQLADGLTHITLGQDISPRPNGRSSTGGYANSSVIGSDGCTFIYFELGWTTEEFLQYSADISRRSEFVSDSRVLTSSTTTNAKLGDMVLSTASTTDYDGDALVYLYVSLPSDCTDLESKRAYLAENPVKITYPKKTLVPYMIDLTDLKPVKGTNNVWSDANGSVEVKFWKH